MWNVYVQIVRSSTSSSGGTNKKGQVSSSSGGTSGGGLQLGVYLQRQSFVDSIPPQSVPRPITSSGPATPMAIVASSSSTALVSSIPTGGALVPLTPAPTRVRDRPWAVHAHSVSVSAFHLARAPTPGSPVAIPPFGAPVTQQQQAQALNPLTTSPTASSGPPPPTHSAPPYTSPTPSPISPYRDPRQHIKAYFSILCPSQNGSSATKFTSAPDGFNVTQSWGWKSVSVGSLGELENLKAKREGGGEEGSSLRAVVLLGVV